MILRRYHKRNVNAVTQTRGYGVPIDKVLPKSIAEMSVEELKALCKKRGIKGYSKLNNVELVELLRESGE